MNKFTLQYAQNKDAEDSLRKYRDEFHFPVHSDGSPILYFCGNSLGLQPKRAQSFIGEVMESWKSRAVDGHFYGEHPWVEYHESMAESLSQIVGAKPQEISVANTLTANLHFLMVSFYKPTSKRHKIIVEDDLFPSDLYAVESQIKHHGFDPETSLIRVSPDEGRNISKEKLLEAIENAGDELALVMLGGLNYYTGQVFPMQEVTEAGHKVGAKVGLDLAHAAGNVPLQLHDWNVDFACWCNYKYLNSGPGAPGGLFVHEKYGNDPKINRFAGWWAQKMDTRFEMRTGFDPIAGAEGWVVSNPPILAMAGVKASLSLFDEIDFKQLRAKSLDLTAYLEDCIYTADLPGVEILTPAEPEHRGCQLSLFFKEHGRKTFEYLHSNGVITDWREPNVIRIAPAPFYNSFEDVFKVVDLMKKAFSTY